MKKLQSDHRVLIIGASHAGISMADQLRKAGFVGEILMLDRESEMPMERPPLSKARLSEAGAEFLMRQPEWFEENKVTFRPNAEAISASIAEGTITLADGEQISWDHLILATGAVPRTLPLEGDQGQERMHTLRVPADAKRLFEALSSAESLAIIGGGYIGLEVASSARKRGLEVTVIEMASRLLARVASPDTSRFFHELHESHGTIVKTSCSIQSMTAASAGITLSLEGEELTADLILAGIGVVPDMTLAESLGLETGNGILVNSHYATKQQGIWAIGDVALPSGGYADGALRIESVHHAQMSAEIAAAAMTGQASKRHEVPWFWSEQYDKKLQSAGLYVQGASTISRQGKREGAISFWSFDASERLISVEAISDPQAFMIGKTILAAQIPLAKAALIDPNFDLKSVLKSA